MPELLEQKPLLIDYDFAGRLLGVSRRSIERLVKDKVLRSVKVHTSVRLRLADVEKLVNRDVE